MLKLAINGGTKVRTKKFPADNIIGKDEHAAVQKVLDSGILSRFLGCWHQNFYGGPEVQALEKEWADYFGVKYAIAVNSATSGLYCAVGAAGVGPGDEVIVSPFTMTSSAIAPLIYNAIPVFADIEEDYFCLSPQSIRERITPQTKAIIIVDIFGQPYDVDEINDIAKENNLLVIEDAAQAPGAKYKMKNAGTLGDIGIYSLNYHKHIHCGEGGIVVTDDDLLAEKVRLIRNHGEVITDERGFSDLVNMLGYNYRMTEIEAAISREQLKKLPGLVLERRKNIEHLNDKLSKIPCLELSKTRVNCSHSFYMHPMKFNKNVAGLHRDKFFEAVKAELEPIEGREAEGILIELGYTKPLYLQSLYQKRVAYGNSGCPWSCSKYKGTVNYEKGICPVAEKMHEDVLIVHGYVKPGFTKSDLDDVAGAFFKVWENRGELV